MPGRRRSRPYCCNSCTERQVVSGNAPVTPARAQHRGRGRVAPAEQGGEGPRLHRSPQSERRGTIPRPGTTGLAGHQRPFGPPRDEIVDVVAAALPHDMHLQHCSSTTAGDPLSRWRCVTRQTHPTGTKQIYATDHCHRACQGAATRRGSGRVERLRRPGQPPRREETGSDRGRAPRSEDREDSGSVPLPTIDLRTLPAISCFGSAAGSGLPRRRPTLGPRVDR